MDRKKNLAIDIGALVVYLVVANPALTGIGAHEWLGFGVLLAFFIHCVVHGDWIFSVASGLKSASWGARGNFALDALILVAFATVMVSGLCISGAVLPFAGLYAPGYFFWDPLHAISAKVLLALLLVHVVVHGRWIASFSGKRKGDVCANSSGAETDRA